MKIVIDIPNELYKGIEERDGSLETEYVCDELMKAVDNGTPLPDNATNGDVIKALFPDGSQVKGASIYVMNDNKSNIFYDFDWWNAPYKAGDINGKTNNNSTGTT